ncbi:MAG: HEAT repeat domain-containing protein, partial [Coriobacteriia bacterium]|nr:HEAT repeat domain-containing protein [Coriobacteriia bacterium]
EQVAAVASAELASGDERRALAAVQVLLGLGDKRLVALAARALDHPTQSVRVGTLRALAEVRSPEAAGVLAAAVQHRDAETRLAAVREIVRAGLDDAMASLLKVLAEDAPLRRNHELKLEILASIEHARYK